MPSVVTCDQGHRSLCREAAIELSERGCLSPCVVSGCGSPRRYLVRHFYSNVAEPGEWEVEHVARLPAVEAEQCGYDPMLFLLRHIPTGHRAIWPFFWGLDSRGKWRVQFSPILQVDDWNRLVSMATNWLNNAEAMTSSEG